MRKISICDKQSDDSICSVDEAWQNNDSIRLTISKDTIVAGWCRTIGLKRMVRWYLRVITNMVNAI